MKKLFYFACGLSMLASCGFTQNFSIENKDNIARFDDGNKIISSREADDLNKVLGKLEKEMNDVLLKQKQKSINGIITPLRVSHSGSGEFTFEYKLEVPATKEDFSNDSEEIYYVCNKKFFRYILDKGGVFKMVILSVDGTMVHSLKVDRALCGF